MKKNVLITGLFVLVAIFLGWKLNSYFAARETITKVTSSVIINQIKNVSKLVTIEGQISEIYAHQDKKPIPFTWSYSEKKAIVKVEATVLVGYNLENMKYEINEEAKSITITYLPEPEVISIDDDISYYDIENGYFNTFEEADYNQINKKVKNLIRQLAQTSDMMPAAEKQGLSMLVSIRQMMELGGWILIFPQGTSLPALQELPKDTL